MKFTKKSPLQTPPLLTNEQAITLFKRVHLGAWVALFRAYPNLQESFTSPVPADLKKELAIAQANTAKYPEVDLEKAVEEINDAIKRLSGNRSPLGGMIMPEVSMLSAPSNGSSVFPFFKTGWKKFDEGNFLGAGKLIILAARLGLGKTSFAINLTTKIISNSPKAHVAWYSIEQSKEELSMKLLSLTSGVPIQQFKNARLQSSDWKNISNAAVNLADTNIFIEDKGSISVDDIEKSISDLAEKGAAPDLVVIDYFQLLRDCMSGPEALEHSGWNAARHLKAIAKKHSCTILVLSQLVRPQPPNENERPMLSTLRYTIPGPGDSDADVICLLHSDESGHDENPRKLSMIIAKHRAGQVGEIGYNLDGNNMNINED